MQVRAISPDSPKDTEAFLTVYRDCLRHYGCDLPAPEVETAVLSELSADHGMMADLAWVAGRAVGFACSVRVFPVGAGFGLYLKELFVSEAARGSGAGRALMRHLARRALAMEGGQLRWETGEAAAWGFYARLGAEADGKTHYSAHGDTLARIARGGP